MIYLAENHLAPYSVIPCVTLCFNWKALPKCDYSVKTELLQKRSLAFAIALSALPVFWSADLWEAGKLQSHTMYVSETDVRWHFLRYNQVYFEKKIIGR